MDPITMENVKKHEAHISRAVMQCIGSAKDLSPILFDNPDHQESIVNGCRDCAQSVFKFRNQVKEQAEHALNVTELQQNLSQVEHAVKTISTILQNTAAPSKNPIGFKLFNSNMEEVISKVSQFNIFLGKLRIASGLKVLSSISQTPQEPPSTEQTKAFLQLETRERGASQTPEYQKKLQQVQQMGKPTLEPGPSMSMPNLHQPPATHTELGAKKGFDKLISSPKIGESPFEEPVLEALREVLSSYQHRSPTSTKKDLLASELRTIDLKWPLFLLQDEMLRRRDAESKLNKLLDGSKIQQLVESWKEKMTRIYDRRVEEKDEVIKQKNSQLERILEVQSKILELKRTGEQGSLEKMQYEKELERKDKEIQELKKRAVEAEKKASETTTKLNEYVSEIEDWKNELTETFNEELHEKDQEIFELRNTLSLLMQKDQSTEEGNLINQLMASIGDSGEKRTSSLLTPGPKKKPITPKATIARLPVDSGNLKVELPQGGGFFTYSILPHSNLATLLGEIRKARGIDTSKLGFQYPDVDPFAPVLPLDLKLTDLGTLSLRLVDKNTDKYKGQTAPTSQPGPSVRATPHSALDQIMSLMSEPEDVQPPQWRLIQEADDWETELYGPTAQFDEEKNRALKDLGKNTPYYKAYISRTEHINFGAFGEKKFGPILISVPKPLKGAPKIQALVRTKYGDEFMMLSSNYSDSDITKSLKAYFGEKVGKDIKVKKLTTPTAVNEILDTEEKLMTKGYKFGVLYRKKNQSEENDMFSNKHDEASPEYKKFLSFLGSEVALNGFSEYRGGLDAKNGTTGDKSVFTKHLGFGVMFHVSTLLPFQDEDPQRLERKRHLGNDVVIIIFQEDDTPFNPLWIKAEFPHVFCVVSPHREANVLKFKVAFSFKGGVGIPTPTLPLPCFFEGTEDFRQFLLTKLINAERNAMYAPSFVLKMQRTRELQLDDLINRLLEQKKSKDVRGSLRKKE